uniref:Metalloendopeptidase n=2 Tax=Cyprinodon variegatus TaxID=28743 RepID=A0A3Q2D374_CYPVA
MPRLNKMQGSSFFIVILVVSPALSMNTQESNTVDIDDNKNNTDDPLSDDIHKPPNTGRSSTLGRDILWKSPVPYTMNENIDLNAKGIILRAFDQFRVKSCIDFKPRDTEEYYLSFQGGFGCWSYIGQLLANGQDISVGWFCDHIGIVEHLIFHSLGFYHEEMRHDRDDYVKIDFDNVIAGQKLYFTKVSSYLSTTHDVPYDYMSVMHSWKYVRSNGNGATIITKDPKFQNVIGQRMEMSPSDAQELNLLYKCNSTAAFMFYCDFSDGTMCHMRKTNRCTHSDNDWVVVSQVNRGPSSDHTTLPAGNRDYGQETGYFIHASTASGQEGDSSRLETQIFTPKRDCKIQCLQFYYFHTGNQSDELNIWIREFQDEQDTMGTVYHMGQIIGRQTNHWQLHYVPLNATKNFRVVFEVRKGAGNSTGGFSIDDINLSETECPHATLQIDDFETLLTTSALRTIIYSPRQYSKDGYAFRIAAFLYQKFVGTYVELLSGDYDNQLEWPCLQRQMTFRLLDQTPNMQNEMSQQFSFVSHPNHMSEGIHWFDNPRENGSIVFSENGESVYGGILVGYKYFATLEELQTKEFLKGGSVIFTFSFEDLTPLVNGSSLPCRQGKPPKITHRSTNWDEGPCFFTGISGFSPGFDASPILILLLIVMLML